MSDSRIILSKSNKRIREFKPLKEKIEIWSDSIIWKVKNEEFFSDWFFKYINHLRPIIIEFVKDGYSQKISVKYNIDYFFLRNLVYHLAKFENIFLAIYKTNQWQGKIGFEIACGKLKEFFNENKRMPVPKKDKYFQKIYNAVQRGNFIEQGIRTWNELLFLIFGKVNHQQNVYKGKEGLDLSIKMLKNFKKKYKRLPIIKDKETGSIQNAIGRGEWKEQGINNWNDLLRATFGEINKEMYIYTGNKGFERAIRELKHFKKINGKKPTIDIKEMRGICTAIYREEWKEQGVNSWNDLLKVAFGEINREFRRKEEARNLKF